jgi:methionyl-tRNA formyltransferase
MNRIAIIGQSSFGSTVARGVLKDKDMEIVGLFTPSDSDSDPLFLFSKENNIDVFRFKKLRSRKAIEQFEKLKVDLLVMAYVIDIVPLEIIKSPSIGTIQYHPSLLPKHRGPSSINWAIIDGDSKTGITIFWPDEGLDTGPILLQKEVKIDSNDSTGSLYFDKLFPLGVKAILESIELIKNNNAPKIIQNEDNASYETWCPKQEIFWDNEPKIIFNLIRGCDPQPGAWTKINSKKVFLYDCRLSDNNLELNHKEMFISKDEVSIGVKKEKITIGRIKTEGEKKINSYEWMKINKIKNHSILG